MNRHPSRVDQRRERNRSKSLRSFSYPPTADFELFPSPPATSVPAPRSRTHVTPTPHQVPRRGALRRDSTAPSQPSPLSTQLDLLNDNIHSSPDERISPAPSTALPQRQQFYASSAPTSSAALPHQAPLASGSARPPVPLFHSNSTGNVQQSAAEKMAPRQGISSMFIRRIPLAHELLLTRARVSAEMNSLFDLPGTPGADQELAAPEAAFLNADMLASQFAGVPDIADLLAQPTPETVSPSELLRDPQASVPASAAFTNLTSPSNFGSPDLADSFETSPMFGGEGATDLINDNWYPLFTGAAPAEHDESPFHGATDDLLDPVTGGLPDDMSPRRRSSQFDSPQPHARHGSLGKPSSVSGVAARKRDKPLPPITIEDPSDSVALKRARNTMAARKSRQRKLERLEELERTVEELEATAEDLRGEVTHWKTMALAKNHGLGQ